MGRPSKLTPEVQTKIVNAISTGNYVETAAAYAGIDPSQYYRWMDRGAGFEGEESRLAELTHRQLVEEAKSAKLTVPKGTRKAKLIEILLEPLVPFREFRGAIKKAEADAEVGHLVTIQQAAKAGTWQAAAWCLERKYPDRWGRRERTEISGPAGGPVDVRTNFDPDELSESISRLAAATARPHP